MKYRFLLVCLTLAVMAAVVSLAVIRPQPAEQRLPQAAPQADRGAGSDAQLPSIRAYQPRSTLVAPTHLVERAKFPVVDIHSHQPAPISPEDYAKVVKSMDQLNVQVMVNLSGGWGDQLRQSLAAIKDSPYPDRMVLFANVDFRNVGPGFGARAAAQLEEDIKAGAKGLKIFKQLGLWDRKIDGSRLKVDDPELDPIWDACARLHVPVLIHTADPQEFFQPFDLHNERWLELFEYPSRRYQEPLFPAFDELIRERDHVFAAHPSTTFIAAHMGWEANDLARLSATFDAMPNVYADVAAVLYDIGRQPRAAHEFFVKYQDRLLFGKDSFQPAEYRYYWRVFETDDEYFDFYRGDQAFWKLYGVNLPDAVLKKLYYANALKVTPGLPAAGFMERTN